MHDRTPYSTSMFCFLAGSVIGAGVALLLAPHAGSATRETMRRKLRATADSARDVKDRVVHRGEEIQQAATERVEAAASALAGGLRTARETADKVASV